MTEPPAATPLLSTTPPAGSDATQEVAVPSGTCYGRFALQRFHAKGGLGEVHVAVDTELGREVALKRMQERCAHDPAAKRRFLNEAEITAKLEHPGIVPIHGLVQDEQGQPCYAMRFIAGESLSEAIKRWHEAKADYTALPFRQLLQRFISVCQTMAYAHSKNVIHRDLKPANVMLGPYGETLVVDWGLAKKIVRDQKSEVSEETEELPTTVDFKRGSEDDRVYTQAGQAMGTAGYMSPEQAAGRWDVVGPASDTYSLGATLYDLLTGERPLRGNDIFAVLQKTQAGDFQPPRQVKSQVPPALEAICLKAMALKPENRYVSATALAADLEHWLADEPVSAYAEPWTVRVRRWMRRHRPLVTGSVVALVGAVVLLGLSLFFVDQNRRQVEQSRQQLATEKEETERQRQAAVTERQAAEAARKRGSKIIDEVVFSDRTLDALKRQKDLTPEQKKFLTDMIGYYEEFVQEEPKDVEGQKRLARAYFRMGYGSNILGRKEQALPAYRRAVEILEKLVADFPTVPAYRHDLANCHGNLGNLWAGMRQWSMAEPAYQRALELREKLAADFPTVPEYRYDLANSHYSLGVQLTAMGQWPKAEAAHQRALRILEKLVADFPTVPEYRYDLAVSHCGLGFLMDTVGQRSTAEAAYRRSLELLEKLVADFPTVASYRSELAQGHDSLSILLREVGKWSAAEAAHRRSVELWENLVADFPALPDYRDGLGNSYNGLGVLLDDIGQRPAAEAAYRRSLEILEKLAADFPTMPGYRKGLALCHNNLGVLLVRVGRRGEAEAAYRRSAEIREKLVADFPTRPEYRHDLAGSYNNLGSVLNGLGRRSSAETVYRQAIEIQEKLTADFPSVPQYRRNLAGSYVNLGILLRDQRQAEASLGMFTKAIALLEPLVRQNTRLVRERLFLHNAHLCRAQALAQLGRHADALKDWDRVLELDVEAKHTTTHRFWRALSLAHAGQHAAAVDEVNLLAEAQDVNDGKLYNLAQVCALAATTVKENPTLQDRYAARAVTLLRQAVAKGYKDSEKLKKDEDLKALRQREDFQKLLQELEKANGSTGR
jgi:serine/threonine-protein kinase